MRKVGLTGGIATGKSTAVEVLRALGAPVFDSDAEVHALYAPGAAGWEALRAAFGEGILSPSGEIDRAALGALVFADEQARARLEGCIHPLIYHKMHVWFHEREAERETVAVADIPLLLEGGWAGEFDEIWLLYVSPEEQLRRVIKRDGLTEEAAMARIRSQWSLEKKLAAAAASSAALYTIDTDNPKEETRARVEALYARCREEAMHEG